MPHLFILIPFLLLLALNLPIDSLKKQFAPLSVGVLLIVQLVSVILYPRLSSHLRGLFGGPFFSFTLSVDYLTLVMLFTIATVSLVSLLVAISTIAQEKQRFSFYNLLLVSLVGMNTTVMVKDLFSLYVFVEITAVAIFVLMAIEKNKFAIEGTFKYLVLSMLASIFILTGIAFFMLASGGISFDEIRSAFLGGSNIVILNLASGLFLCGLLIKSGAMPFHGWVPDAYSNAQASVSVLLAGIVTKISGIYVLLRLFGCVFVLRPQIQNVLMVTGTASIVLAALAAFTQSDFKRLLSYSSISQVGYILLALGCGTPLAFAGAVFHFFNHAIFKSLLFVNAASLEKKLHSTEIPFITGLGYRLPVTRATSLIGLLSTAGIPPFAGFWSKLIIVIALLSAGKTAYASIALLASVITLAYFLYFERNVFFIKTEDRGEQEEASVPFSMRLCEIVLACVTVAVGLCFPFFAASFLLPIKDIVH